MSVLGFYYNTLFVLKSGVFLSHNASWKPSGMNMLTYTTAVSMDFSVSKEISDEGNPRI